jgi:hypothetical protein
MTDLDTFINLSDHEIARLLNQHTQRVCVFPVNGVKRWYTMEHGKPMDGDWNDNDMDEISKKLLELYSLLFNQGLQTLVSPLHGADLLAQDREELRDEKVRRLEILTTHSDFLSFYEKFGVRVHFFGDFRRQLAGTRYAYLVDQFERLSKHTRKNTRRRLFFGVLTGNAAENIADLSVKHFIRTGKVPNRRTLMELYYGDAIETVDIFIGFDKFRPAEYPLLDLAEENLYFTVTPSFSLTRDQLRRILHDHLYARHHPKPDYSQLSEGELEKMKDFYRTYRGTTLRLGKIQPGAVTALPNCQT